MNSTTSTGGVDRTPTHKTPLCSTVCSKARNASHVLGSRLKTCITSFGRLRRVCHLVRTCLILCWSLLHPPFPKSTSSSLSTLSTTIGTTRPSPRTPVHHQPPVDKQRHQESLWRENLQSGGNPRTTTPTSGEASDLRNRERVVLDLILKLKICKMQDFL